MSTFSPRFEGFSTIVRRACAPIARTAAIPTSALLLAFAVACGGDADATEPPPTATHSPATPARPPDGATATPVTSPAAPTPAPRATGNPRIDTVLAAIQSHDANALAALAKTITAGCSTAQGAGGPPRCATGQAAGTIVTRFPFSSCEGEYLDPASLGQFFAGSLTSNNPKVYAVASTKEPGTALAPQGDYIVVLETKGAQGNGGGRVLHLDAEGRIVSYWSGCGGTAQQLFEGRKGASVLLPPLQAS